MASISYSIFFFFFFQAEDGIRDYKVTGVQVCSSDLKADDCVVALDRSVDDARRALLPLRCHSQAQRRSRPPSRPGVAPTVLRGGHPARAVRGPPLTLSTCCYVSGGATPAAAAIACFR